MLQKIVSLVLILAMIQCANFSFCQAATYSYETVPTFTVLEKPEEGGDYSGWGTGSWDVSSRTSDQESSRRKRSIIGLVMGPTYGHRVSQHKTEAQLLHPPPPADGFVSVRGKKRSPMLRMPKEMRQSKHKDGYPSSFLSSFTASSSQDMPPQTFLSYYLSQKDQTEMEPTLE